MKSITGGKSFEELDRVKPNCASAEATMIGVFQEGINTLSQRLVAMEALQKDKGKEKEKEKGKGKEKAGSVGSVGSASEKEKEKGKGEGEGEREGK